MYHDINEVADTVEYLLKNYQQSAMGTSNGFYPEVTKVTPVLFDDDNIYLLLSDMSTHTYNIRNVSKCVTLYFAGDHRYVNTEMNNPRATLYGNLELIDQSLKSDMLLGFNKRDKGATNYGKFRDFNIWKFVEKDRLYIEGFGKAYK